MNKKWTVENPLSDIPETLTPSHTAPRLSQQAMLEFEHMLEMADATANSVFEERKRKRTEPVVIGDQRRVKLGFDDDDDNDADISRALVSTIAATTGAAPPKHLTTTGDAIRWASASILQSRNNAIVATRREKYVHALSPDQTVRAMKLIDDLSSLLDGARR